MTFEAWTLVLWMVKYSHWINDTLCNIPSSSWPFVNQCKLSFFIFLFFSFYFNAGTLQWNGSSFWCLRKKIILFRRGWEWSKNEASCQHDNGQVNVIIWSWEMAEKIRTGFRCIIYNKVWSIWIIESHKFQSISSNIFKNTT